MTLEPALLDFGQVTVGQSAEQVVVLGNTGASALTVSYAMDPQGSEFVFVGHGGSPHGGTVVLLPGQPDSLRVSFGPEGEGHRTATVLFEDDQMVELGSVSLEGEGVSNPTALTRYYYVRDHLGSVRATVDASGAVVHYDDYYPFGAPMPGRGMDDTAPRERFTGHEAEEDIDPDEKAVYYAGKRYYDGLMGRWMTVDPLADEYPGISPYNYVLNNPLALVDPDGECPVPTPKCPAFIRGFVRGAIKGVKNTVTGAINAVREPVKTYASAVFLTQTEVGKQVLARSVVSGAKESLIKAASSPEGAGEVTGAINVAAAEAVAGSKGAGTGAKLLTRLLRTADKGGDAGKIVGSIVHSVLRSKAGFADEGIPLIVDNSLGVNPQRVATALRDRGLNARSVQEIFGADPGDTAIRELAEHLGGRVVAVDRGRDVGGGFGRLTIRIDGRVRQTDTVVRIVEDSLNQ